MTLTLDAAIGARGVDLRIEVPAGGTLAVVGPNGAGKSTLLAMIAGLVRADRGAARLGGDTLFDVATRRFVPAHRRGVALLDQRPSLFPHLDVRRNVLFGARSGPRGRADSHPRTDRWLAEVGASELADARAGELSGGQAQRVALARALAAEPRTVLLDEPLAALDVAVAVDVRRMLRRVLEGRTAVLVTHEVLDAWMLADRVAVVEDGRVVDVGDPDQVLARPRTDFVADLVGTSLIRGVRIGSGIALADGRTIPATGSTPLGSEVVAGVAPTSVRIARPGEGGVEAVITALEPRGATLRIRTDLVAVDLAPSVARDLAEGDRIRLVVDPPEMRAAL